ncbi:FecR domain-containing protein [Candidatus Poribacteria bacterium]|nr:FecR domain-containing protein [Candidatus Poribacteria bacterium]
MQIKRVLNFAAFFLCMALSMLLGGQVFGAALQTPTGKKIPGKILGEADKVYRVGTDLPGGGRIIFNMQKDKVDPHGTVPGKGRIESIKGTAEIKKAGMPRFVTAFKHMSVNPGDEIRTGPDSEVVVTLETMAISGIGANSQFTIKHFEQEPETKAAKIKIDLPEGKLWSEVGRLKTKDSKFEVETPTAVTGVRGTVFLVEVEKATADTSVSVLSGQVAVGSKGVAAPEMILNKREALIVKAGQEPRKFGPSELLAWIVQVVEEWMERSESFKSVTALAGIGQVEEIEIQPGLPEAQRQQVYDAIQAGWEKAAEDFFQIDKALKMFYLDFARFPTVKEGGLKALISMTGVPQWNGPYCSPETIRDHYGVPYVYAVLTDAHGNVFAEITTYGYDQTPGTNDDRQKIIKEEDARRWEDGKNYR